MASSSVSQDDVDISYEASSRRYKIRTARARQINPTQFRQSEKHDKENEREGGTYSLTNAPSAGLVACSVIRDHDVSPKPINRIKEKRTLRPGNITKGKPQKGRRKLREKRRSPVSPTIPTESTDDELLSFVAESGSETGDNNLPDNVVKPVPIQQTPLPQECKKIKKALLKARTRSPSDLEADDEDNQDYDSLTMNDSMVSLSSEALSNKMAALTTQMSKSDLLRPGHRHPSLLLRGTSYCSGVCSMGGYLLNNLTGNRQLAIKRASGRPTTPIAETSEELLKKARAENTRLQALLCERENRIVALEKRLAAVSADKRSLDSADTPCRGASVGTEEEVPNSSNTTSSSSSCNISSNRDDEVVTAEEKNSLQ